MEKNKIKSASGGFIVYITLALLKNIKDNKNTAANRSHEPSMYRLLAFNNSVEIQYKQLE